jgi:predicted metal-dependent peptidase
MDKITKAKNRLLITEPFFGYLLLKLKFINDTQEKYCTTMCVDGESLWYSPNYINNTSLNILIGSLVHELLHCILKHIVRGKDHHPKISNYAADYVVNDYILNKTSFELPKFVLYEDKFKDMSYEKVYDILIKENSGKPDKALSEISEKLGTFKASGNKIKTENITQSLDDQWTNNIQEAAALVKNTSQGASELIEELVQSTVPAQLPWEKILARFLQKQVKTSSNWAKPNRRYAHQGLYLPSKNSKIVGDITIAIDTSCSVTIEEFAHIIAEINKILLKVRPDKITLLHCDTDIRAIETYTAKDLPFNTAMKGRGGTSFSPVFQYIEDNRLNPLCLIYFSDLEGSFNFQAPRYPTLWINTYFKYNKAIAPFGTTIELNL